MVSVLSPSRSAPFRAFLRAAPLALLAACAAPAPAPEPAPDAVDRIAAECALLERAETMIGAAGQTAPSGLREGCPGVSARDTRALDEQMASLRAATGAPLPPGVQPGSRAETVYRRMITRGVPVSLARQLTGDPLFAIASHSAT
ncbi:hypothetical protein C4N9_12335 [Pararhodobacter marinus]|uniref:Uncharacterized protein n=1 Tax=Pararhodobacter marinus TaxID=2184063 RepID=A0A2U2C8L8_9RHOB|nr:hypothetical protein C4N9_12335 [Pararhodobacter marinus]